ncbi:MAG: TIGR02391 family protein [Spirochaetota bacterium]
MESSINIELRQDLLDAIQGNYDKNNFTETITDAIIFLSSTIRNRANLDLDGVALIGKAFGSEEPVLKINSLRTESEKNAQRGFEHLLRGVFQGIRNPRSHEKHSDNRETCHSVVAIVNYALNIVESSTERFSLDKFMMMVLDEDFVETQEYSDLVTKDIPSSRIEEVLKSVVLSDITVSRARLIIQSIQGRMNEKQQADFCEEFSNLLAHTTDEKIIRLATKVFQKEKWLSLSPLARIRIENKLLKSAAAGKYDENKSICKEGALGTWLSNILPHIQDIAEFDRILVNKLSSSSTWSKHYIQYYFGEYIYEMHKKLGKALLHCIVHGLEKGDKVIYEIVTMNQALIEGDAHIPEIKVAYENFSERKVSFDDDDIPF